MMRWKEQGRAFRICRHVNNLGGNLIRADRVPQMHMRIRQEQERRSSRYHPESGFGIETTTTTTTIM